MRELALNEVEQWYIDELDNVFFKEKKILNKNLERLDKFLVNLNHAVSKIKEREQDVELEEKMQFAAQNLEFETAAALRDQIYELRNLLADVENVSPASRLARMSGSYNRKK